MKRISLALAMCLGLMMNACGSSGSSTPAATCTNQYGQVVTGSVVNGICQATTGTCTPCAYGGTSGVTNPQTGVCMPAQYATSVCGGQTGYGGYGGYGGGYYPYGGGYGGYPYSGYGGYGGYSSGYSRCGYVAGAYGQYQYVCY